MEYQLKLFDNVGSLTSTSSAAGSPAKTSVAPARERASKAAARVYGERCLGLSAKSDPLGSSLRTYLLSACEALTGLSLRWKESATPSGHWWLVLGWSERRTSGTGCGSSRDWKTPQRHDEREQGQNRPIDETGRIVQASGETRGLDLALQVKLDWRTPATTDVGTPPEKLSSVDGGPPELGHRMYRDGKNGERINQTQSLGLQAKMVDWPTPRSSENENRTTQPAPSHGNGHGKVLAGEVQLWATPSETDYKGSVTTERAAESTRGVRLPEQITKSAGQAAQANPSTPGSSRGSLNSRWVMSLMGFPPEYSDELIRLLCEYSATPGVTKTPSLSSAG